METWRLHAERREQHAGIEHGKYHIHHQNDGKCLERLFHDVAFVADLVDRCAGGDGVVRADQVAERSARVLPREDRDGVHGKRFSCLQVHVGKHDVRAQTGTGDECAARTDQNCRCRIEFPDNCCNIGGKQVHHARTGRLHDVGNDEKASCAVRWLRGEYSTKTEAKQDLGVNVIITDDNWYDYIKLLTAFFVSAGYKGFVIMIDELVNIMKIPHAVTRQYNYEKILMMYNDVMQGKASHLGIIMGGTPQCIEDTRRGIFSYDALRSRLERGRFATDETHDMLAPIIKLQPLSYEEMTVLCEKLAEIHAGLYGYENRMTLEDRIYFIKAEFSRVGAETNITPREMIRDYIELLNIAMQNPDKTIAQLMGEESFEFAKPEGEASSDEKDGFEDFEL